MEGTQPIDRDGDMPIESIFISASLSRGREPQADTHRCRSFTCKELDAIAPLSHSDLLSMRLNMPSAQTKANMRRRIEAACNLKYGTNDVK